MKGSILRNHGSEIAKAISAKKYEMAENGILLTNRSNLFIGGAFKHHDFKGDVKVDHNLLVTEGLIQILNSALAGQTQLSAFYISLFSGNYTPVAGLTAAAYASAATEFTDYTSGTRPVWTAPAATLTAELTNAAAEAVFTYNGTGPYNIYGSALISSSVKSGTGGKLIAATRFDVTRTNQISGDRLGVEYSFTAVDAG